MDTFGSLRHPRLILNYMYLTCFRSAGDRVVMSRRRFRLSLVISLVSLLVSTFFNIYAKLVLSKEAVKNNSFSSVMAMKAVAVVVGTVLIMYESYRKRFTELRFLNGLCQYERECSYRLDYHAKAGKATRQTDLILIQYLLMGSSQTMSWGARDPLQIGVRLSYMFKTISMSVFAVYFCHLSDSIARHVQMLREEQFGEIRGGNVQDYLERCQKLEDLIGLADRVYTKRIALYILELFISLADVVVTTYLIFANNRFVVNPTVHCTFMVIWWGPAVVYCAMLCRNCTTLRDILVSSSQFIKLSLHFLKKNIVRVLSIHNYVLIFQ